MSLIPEEKIAEIRERVDIVSIIGEFVPLRRAGTSFIGLCPFHTEKTPSFHVNPVKQFFYCFGCQKSGDVIRFLMEKEGRSFTDAIEDLARRAGVEIEKEKAPRKASFGFSRNQTLAPNESAHSKNTRSEKETFLKIHQFACLWFQKQLSQNEEAKEYLRIRGLTEPTISQFRLGYAPNAWDEFVQVAKKKGIPLELLLKSGLVVQKEPGRVYDRFRHRIMFPLCNLFGEVIGFGGRILPEPKVNAGASGTAPPEITSSSATPPKTKMRGAASQVAKYMNSPETALYKKGEHLYGLSVAKEAIQKQKQAVLVEGNFDVLSLYEKGFKNVVAPMGTALTKTQVQLLRRVLGEEGSIILMLDGDRAGQAATLKDVFLFTEENLNDVALLTESQMEVKVVVLPEGQDPDTYIASNPAGFVQKLNQAKPALDYVLDQVIAQAKHEGISEKAKAVTQVLPLLKAIRNPAALEMSIMKLASNLAIDPGLVVRQLRSNSYRSIEKNRIEKKELSPRPLSHKQALLHSVVRNLLSLCGDHPYVVSLLKDETLDRLDHPAVAELLKEARFRVEQGATIQATDFIELSPRELKNEVASAVFAGTFNKIPQPQRALESICETILKQHLKREIQEFREKLALASEEGDQDKVIELTARLQELMKKYAKD